ncbi:MAG: U32 family peptidase [Erysipelotrichaceae bacterium]|nr:U32 family peptidase [Erysipelotrichaceae bacterium]
MSKVELLAPSGNFECVKAAVASGANAVYLGGQLFSARAYANNFSTEELDKVCDYCHGYGVKVYVTVNTLYKDSEFEQLISFIDDLYRIGVDGLIMQDLGAISLVRKCYPDLPVHASTQLTANSLDEVRAFEAMGLTTVVLSRELSLEEIKYICSNTSVRIEVFIHGALCVSYSGQCYISSVLGNRSGNRGKCAQNCRLEYTLSSEGKKLAEGHLLSTKDICTVDHLKELLDCGVASLKIEGRMKTPEYVAQVTSVYRHYIDEYYKGNYMKISNEDMLALQFSFNRGGFSEGYLKARSGPDMMCPVHPRNWGVYAGKVISYDARKELVTIRFNRDMNTGDGVEIWSDDENGTGFYVNKTVRKNETAVFKVKGRIRKDQAVYQTFNKALNDAVDHEYKNSRRKIDVKCLASIRSDREMRMTLKYGELTVSVNGSVPSASINQPLTAETVLKQLSKTGNTNVNFSEIDIELDEGLFVNRADLNSLRNQAVDRLNEAIILNSKRKSVGAVLPELTYRKAEGDYRVNVLVRNMEQLKAVIDDELVETVYLPCRSDFDYAEAIDLRHLKGKKAVIKLPRLWRQHTQNTYSEAIGMAVESEADGFMIHNIGQFQHMKDSGKPLYLDFTGNVINSYTRAFWNRIERVSLSVEASVEEIEKLADNTKAEVLVYGRLPLMITEQCPVGNCVGNKKKIFCRKKNSAEKYYLENRGSRFLLNRDCEDCICTVESSEPLKRFSLINRISVPYYRIDLSDESADQTVALLKEIKKVTDSDRDFDNNLARIYYRSIA